ncbi:MAG: c-type cytochrome [Betaproteobacteria bacterium]
MSFAVKVRVVAAVFVCGVALTGVGSAHAASGEEVIKARLNFMENMEKHWSQIAAFVKGNGTLADVEKNARAISKMAHDIPKHFPRDTGRGKFPDKLTRTLPVVWEDPEGFKQDIKRLIDGSETLARLAREGKKDEALEMIGPGSYMRTTMGCADCHNNFRGPRVK